MILEASSKKGDSRYGHVKLKQRSRVLKASPSWNGEESGFLEAARQRAEATLRKLSPSELETIKDRLNLDEYGLHGTEDIIKRAVPILAAKLLANETARISLSGENLDGGNGPDRIPTFESISEEAPETGEERWAGGVKDSVRRGEGRELPEEGGVERSVDFELAAPLGYGERVYFATCPR